jgi:diguanylate cyclase (GGDEF)-like protein
MSTSLEQSSLVVQYAVARTLAKAASLEEATPPILRAICETLGWEVGMLWRVDAAAEVLRFVEIWRLPTGPLDRFESASRGRTFDRGVGLPGRVWASGQAAWIADVVSDANFPRAMLAAEVGLHAGVAFPVRLGAEILGVFEFFARTIKPPEDNVLRMMEGVGSQIGQFDERRRSEAALAQKAAELQQANERLALQNQQLTEAHAALTLANERLGALATTDSLTGIANHRAFQDRLTLFVADAGRGRRVSLIMLDMDHFKEFNDSYGHLAGDEILIQVAGCLKGRMRKVDLAARYGGEEFAVLVADAGEPEAAALAEELRRRVTRLDNAWRPITASFGVAAFGQHIDSGAALVQAADRALYHAKSTGRDRVVRYSELPPSLVR